MRTPVPMHMYIFMYMQMYMHVHWPMHHLLHQKEIILHTVFATIGAITRIVVKCNAPSVAEDV
jgi:hypothetical protein